MAFVLLMVQVKTARLYTGPISTEISKFIAVLRNDKREVHSGTE